MSATAPRIWHRTLDPKTYELRERGSTWAVARESTAGSPFWGTLDEYARV